MTSNSATNHFSIDEVVKQLSASVSLPEEIIEIFSEEANDHLQKIYDGLGQLKDNPHDMKALGEVRRVSHTLKGAAGAVGHQVITRLAHRMEDLLDQLAENNCSEVSSIQLELLFCTADQLQELSTGEFDSKQAAAQIVGLYQVFEEQIGPGSANQDANAGEPFAQMAGTNQQLDNQTAPVCSSEPGSVPNGGATEYLRVPLNRLDRMSKLLGEMTVNRSEFEHRLQEFGVRINDMQNALERMRSVTPMDVESFGASGNFRGNRPLETLRTNRRDEFDPLEFEQFSESDLFSQQLSEADSDAEMMAGEFNKIKQDFTSLLRRQQQLNRETQKCLLQVRLVPIGAIANRLERTVRTVSRKLQRPVEFHLTGKEIEVDKTVLDEIADPILHLIRNAIDHGVEDTGLRVAAGKPEAAQLRLQAVNLGTQVTLKISDDGAGLDTEKIKQKAISLGMIEADANLAADDLHALIFRPGFSTASELTDVSGRGIGMDVVSDAVRRLKGTIRVDSERSAGTTFTIQIPTVVGVSRALFLESAGQQFAIPIQSVHKIARLQAADVKTDGDQRIAKQADGDLRLIDLSKHLGLRRINSRLDSSEKPMPMLILGSGEDSVGVTVDAILGCRDIVVKGLGSHLKQVRGLMGATIAGNGSVVPILDSEEIVTGKSCNMLPEDLDECRPVRNSKKLAMVVDDSISVRRVNESLLKFAGWDVVTATDGVDALARLAELETEPDVFLCDLEMPRMDGFEFIRQVRDQEEFQSTPIVMVTSRSSEKHRHKAFEAGATEFVVKPYDRDRLLNMLAELVVVAEEWVCR